jgi:hypothetical protein
MMPYDAVACRFVPHSAVFCRTLPSNAATINADPIFKAICVPKSASILENAAQNQARICNQCRIADWAFRHDLGDTQP